MPALEEAIRCRWSVQRPPISTVHSMLLDSAPVLKRGSFSSGAKATPFMLGVGRKLRPIVSVRACDPLRLNRDLTARLLQHFLFNMLDMRRHDTEMRG